MDDELLPQPPQQQAPENDMSWDGRTAIGPDGTRIVWRGNTRTGRFTALNYETADPQSRERVEAVQNMAGIGRRTLPTAQQFIERNATIPTGGMQNTLEGGWRSLAAGIRPTMFANADELAALSSRMVGSNWQPGTTGMFNTATEQEQIRSRFPSPARLGSANVRTYVSMAEEIAAQEAAVRSMQQWLTQHPNLAGWDAPGSEWEREEQQVRQRAREAAWEFYRRTRNEGGQGVVTRSVPPQRPRGVDPRATWNARDRTWDLPD